MKVLPDLQSNFLKQCFEEVFEEDFQYFQFVPIDDVFMYMIGDEIDYKIIDAVLDSARQSENDLSFLCFVHEWMKMIETVAVGLEYFEMAANALQLKKELNQIMKIV